MEDSIAKTVVRKPPRSDSDREDYTRAKKQLGNRPSSKAASFTGLSRNPPGPSSRTSLMIPSLRSDMAIVASRLEQMNWCYTSQSHRAPPLQGPASIARRPADLNHRRAVATTHITKRVPNTEVSKRSNGVDAVHRHSCRSSSGDSLSSVNSSARSDSSVCINIASRSTELTDPDLGVCKAPIRSQIQMDIEHAPIQLDSSPKKEIGSSQVNVNQPIASTVELSIPREHQTGRDATFKAMPTRILINSGDNNVVVSPQPSRIVRRASTSTNAKFLRCRNQLWDSNGAAGAGREPWHQPIKPARSTFGKGAYSTKLGAWQGGNVLSDNVVDQSDLASLVKDVDISSREAILQHTPLSDLDVEAAKEGSTKFVTRCRMLSRPVHTLVLLSVGNEPVEWLKDSLTSIVANIDDLNRNNSSWKCILLVIDCNVTASRQSLWLLQALGLLNPKCFDQHPSAHVHLFEKTIEGDDPLYQQTFSPTEVQRSPIQVMLMVQSGSNICSPKDFLTHLKSDFEFRVPIGTMPYPNAFRLLIECINRDPSLDASVAIIEPQTAMVAAFATYPTSAAHAFSSVTDALFNDFCSSSVAMREAPDPSRLSLIKANASNSWNTATEPAARAKGKMIRSSAEVFDTERNRKFSEWLSLRRQWSHGRPMGLPRLAILSLQGLLWYFNFAIVWTVLLVMLQISGDPSGIFQLMVAFVLAFQAPLLLSESSVVIRTISLRMSLWTMRVLSATSIIVFFLSPNNSGAKIRRVLWSRDLSSLTGELVLMLSLFTYILCRVLASLVHWKRLSYMALSLPHDLLCFPGRFISAVPYSSRHLSPTKRPQLVVVWLSANVVAMIFLSHIPYQLLLRITTGIGASSILISVCQLIASVRMAFIWRVRNACSSRGTSGRLGTPVDTALHQISIAADDEAQELFVADHSAHTVHDGNTISCYIDNGPFEAVSDDDNKVISFTDEAVPASRLSETSFSCDKDVALVWNLYDESVDILVRAENMTSRPVRSPCDRQGSFEDSFEASTTETDRDEQERSGDGSVSSINVDEFRDSGIPVAARQPYGVGIPCSDAGNAQCLVRSRPAGLERRSDLVELPHVGLALVEWSPSSTATAANSSIYIQ